MSSGLQTAGRAALPFALYLAAVGALWAVSPWRPAFDDSFHLQDGLRWMHAGELNSSGLFLRVPLWPVMLGTSFAGFGVRGGVFALQAAIVLAAFVAFALATREPAKPAQPDWTLLAPALLLAASPQLVLYSRHAVNELWIGLLAMGVVLLGRRITPVRALGIGALVAAAGMTKVVGFALLLPAALLLWPSPQRLRLGLACAAGLAAVVAPLLWLHVAQHGTWLLDNTGAYQLSVFTLREWRSFDGAEARYAAGLSSFFELFGNAPLAYLRDFAWRSVEWLLHPSSADFASFYPGYPQWPLRVADEFVFALLGILAALGTRRRDAPIWWFAAAIWIASTFPSHTPYTPKLMLLFPWLLLAPAGLARIVAYARPELSRTGSGADRAA